MPQIAQQDYIKAVATLGRPPKNDCNVLSVLAKALEAGTIFDVIVVYTDGGVICQSKILGYEGTTSYFFDVINNIVDKIDVLYSPAQYAALSAIQLEADRGAEEITGIPGLENNNGLLLESVTGYPICNLDGYKYAITAADGKIATISVSNELAAEGDIIVLDEETAQDLIGLPLV